MTRDNIYALCKTIAPKYGYDPLMVLAQLEQESSYNESEPRLEEGFYLKYVRTHPVLSKTTPAVRVMMASSYGYGQLMGLSLYELDWFPNLDSLTVAASLDSYVGSPADMIDTMCRWLKKKQGEGDGTLTDALRRYNGSAAYPPLIYARHKKLKGIYG